VWESTPDYRWIGKYAGLTVLGTFWGRIFPRGFCYSQNIVEFSAQNLSNIHFGKNSQSWQKEMSFSMKNDISDKKIYIYIFTLIFFIKHRITVSQNVRDWKGPLWVI